MSDTKDWSAEKMQKKLAARSNGADCAVVMGSWQERIRRSDSRSAFESSFTRSMHWNTISSRSCQWVVFVLPGSIKFKDGVQENTRWKGRAFRASASLHKTTRFYHRLLCHLVHWSLLRPFRRRSFQSFQFAEDMWLESPSVLWQCRFLCWDCWLAVVAFAPTSPVQGQPTLQQYTSPC